jgi:predicted acetyltransferase
MTVELIRPDVKYRRSYLQAVHELKVDNHHRYRNVDVDALESGFELFIASELSEQPQSDRVPDTIYWLVEGDEFIGRISLRHYLNEFLRRYGGHIGYEVRPSRRRQGHGTHMLALLLEKARQRGMERVMLTCDVNNLGSRRIIEANGGVLEDIQEWPEVNPNPYCRYWIDLSSPT